MRDDAVVIVWLGAIVGVIVGYLVWDLGKSVEWGGKNKALKKRRAEAEREWFEAWIQSLVEKEEGKRDRDVLEEMERDQAKRRHPSYRGRNRGA